MKRGTKQRLEGKLHVSGIYTRMFYGWGFFCLFFGRFTSRVHLGRSLVIDNHDQLWLFNVSKKNTVPSRSLNPVFPGFKLTDIKFFFSIYSRRCGCLTFRVKKCSASSVSTEANLFLFFLVHIVSHLYGTSKQTQHQVF